jgi:hypothetical protein
LNFFEALKFEFFGGSKKELQGARVPKRLSQRYDISRKEAPSLSFLSTMAWFGVLGRNMNSI